MKSLSVYASSPSTIGDPERNLSPVALYRVEIVLNGNYSYYVDAISGVGGVRSRKGVSYLGI